MMAVFTMIALGLMMAIPTCIAEWLRAATKNRRELRAIRAYYAQGGGDRG